LGDNRAIGRVQQHSFYHIFIQHRRMKARQQAKCFKEHRKVYFFVEVRNMLTRKTCKHMSTLGHYTPYRTFWALQTTAFVPMSHDTPPFCSVCSPPGSRGNWVVGLTGREQNGVYFRITKECTEVSQCQCGDNKRRLRNLFLWHQ
jgi:hypothetical protein